MTQFSRQFHDDDDDDVCEETISQLVKWKQQRKKIPVAEIH